MNTALTENASSDEAIPRPEAIRLEEALAPMTQVSSRAQARRLYSDGPGPGLDPTRYGDWEYAGRCTDF